LILFLFCGNLRGEVNMEKFLKVIKVVKEWTLNLLGFCVFVIVLSLVFPVRQNSYHPTIDPYEAVGFLYNSHDGEQGTAFWVSPTIAVSAAHVCGTAKEVIINGMKGTVVFLDNEYDICFLKTEKENRYFTLSDEKLVRDQEIKTIGHPATIIVPIKTSGIYSGSIFFEGHPVDIYSLPVYNGNSGGPLINAKNEVVGVVVRCVTGYSQISMGINSKVVKKLIEKTGVINGK
jgi:V8-like Glu-specific endopeptidase